MSFDVCGVFLSDWGGQIGFGKASADYIFPDLTLLFRHLMPAVYQQLSLLLVVQKQLVKVGNLQAIGDCHLCFRQVDPGHFFQFGIYALALVDIALLTGINRFQLVFEVLVIAQDPIFAPPVGEKAVWFIEPNCFEIFNSKKGV